MKELEDMLHDWYHKEAVNSRGSDWDRAYATGLREAANDLQAWYNHRRD